MSVDHTIPEGLIPDIDLDDILPPSVPILCRQDGISGCDCEARRIAAAAAAARSTAGRQRHCPCCMHWKPKAKRIRNRTKKQPSELKPVTEPKAVKTKPIKDPKAPKAKRARKQAQRSLPSMKEDMIDQTFESM